MGSESVGSSNPLLEFNKSKQGQVPILHNMDKNKNTCFYCQKPGHWAANCPEKLNMKKNQESSSSPTGSSGGGTRPAFVDDDDQSIADVPCPCGGGTCIVLTSKTDKNPGRKFYKCPRPMGMKCNYFHWCDIEISDQPRIPNPMCPCGAGICDRKTSGKYNGRPFFVCPLKQGEGACGFICWEDDVEKILNGGHLDENKQSPRSTYNGQETRRTHEGRSYSPLIKECHGKEDMIRLDTMTVVSSGSPIRSPVLTDYKTAVSSTERQCFSGSAQRRDDVPESSHPMCPCGAGLCTRHIVTEGGENKGRPYFVCPVEKGEGACGFFQWGVQETITNSFDEQKKHGDGDKGKGIVNVNPVSTKGGLDSSTLTSERRFDSDSIVFSDLVKNLQLNEEQRTIPVGHCLWCGKEGHWSKECITMNPPCFRCGKSGHWMKDCTA